MTNLSNSESLYKYIFITNVLKQLDEQGMSKADLAVRSGVSSTFVGELAMGKGNPSLKIMGAIADALDVPLPHLLESTDLDQEAIDAIMGGKKLSSLPAGYSRISAVLPNHQVFLVKKWAEAAQRKIREQFSR